MAFNDLHVVASFFQKIKTIIRSAVAHRSQNAPRSMGTPKTVCLHASLGADVFFFEFSYVFLEQRGPHKRSCFIRKNASAPSVASRLIVFGAPFARRNTPKAFAPRSWWCLFSRPTVVRAGVRYVKKRFYATTTNKKITHAEDASFHWVKRLRPFPLLLHCVSRDDFMGREGVWAGKVSDPKNHKQWVCNKNKRQ